MEQSKRRRITLWRVPHNSGTFAGKVPQNFFRFAEEFRKNG